MTRARLHDYILWDGITPLTNLDIKVVCNPILKIKRHFDKGIKLYSEYIDENENLVFKKTWEEINNNTIIKKFQVIGINDEIVEEKEIVIQMDSTLWEERKERQRKDAMRYLKVKAKESGFGIYIDQIYSFFHDELLDFYETGSSLFKDEILRITNIDLLTVPEEEREFTEVIKNILNAPFLGTETKNYEIMVYQAS